MKNFLLLFTFILIAFSGQSQNFSFGLKAGGNYADINGKDLDKNDHRYKLSWHAGGLVKIQYPGNTYFSIQPEIIYSRKGYESTSLPAEFHDSKGNLLYKVQRGGLVKLNYIDIPLMLNFKTGILVFDFGPQVSFLVGTENEAVVHQTLANGTVITTEDDQRRFDKDQVRKMDIGIATGMRLETASGVGLGLRFNQGFLKLNNGKATSGNNIGAPNAYNQVFQLYASILIHRYLQEKY